MRGSNTGKKIKCKKCHKTLFFAWLKPPSLSEAFKLLYIEQKCDRCGHVNTIGNKKYKVTQNAESVSK